MRRRGVLAGLGGGLTVGAAATGGSRALGDTRAAVPRAQSGDPVGTMDGPPVLTVGLEYVAGGFATPTAFVDVPDADLAYVADQAGRIALLGPDGRHEDPLLDLSGSIVPLREGYEERGLLGMALHPSFSRTRRLFVTYSAPPRVGTPADHDHTFVLSEFLVDGDGLGIDPATERTVLEVPQPMQNNNGGDVVFGHDGYLYLGLGDGGGLGDPDGNGQDVTENLLGSVLRLDVNGDAGGSGDGDGGTTGDGSRGGYAIPPDNPLVDRPGLPEQYAWGFKNPWRLSVDGEDCYVADVGEHRYEEIDRLVAGGNYGWPIREGRHCFEADDCPTSTPDGEPVREPVLEYPHTGAPVSGPAVVGGHVYRGDAVPELRGHYVFADWRANGRLFVTGPVEADPWRSIELPTVPPGTPEYVSAFGQDRQGELYVLTTTTAGPTGSTGAVYRLVPREAASDPPSTAGTTGARGSARGTGSRGTSSAGSAAGGGPVPGLGVLGALGGFAGAVGGRLIGGWPRGIVGDGADGPTSADGQGRGDGG